MTSPKKKNNYEKKENNYVRDVKEARRQSREVRHSNKERMRKNVARKNMQVGVISYSLSWSALQMKLDNVCWCVVLVRKQRNRLSLIFFMDHD